MSTKDSAWAAARQAKVRASYNRISRWYDLLAGASERRSRETGVRKLDIRPGQAVLEIGHGTGQALVALAQAAGSEGHVWGLDIAEGMSAIAQQRVADAGVAARVTLVQGTGTRLPFRDNLVDAIYMSFTLEIGSPSEIPVVLDECRRILRPGGKLCVVAMSNQGHANLMTRLYSWAHQRFPHIVDCRPIQAGQTLGEAGYDLLESTIMSIWGLPVEIVVARPLERT